MPVMIEATGLTKTYPRVKALDGLDLEVPEGSIYGLLGPNGAGKTTAVSILTTLTVPDAGSASVAGLDVQSDAAAVRSVIGLSGQYAAVDEQLSGYENLEMIGRLYHLGRKTAVQRARDLLDRFDLVEAAGRPVKTYSGGMRRRLDLAGALVAQPPVLFLDEPTTGLDPRSRLELWTIIQELVERGTTVLLTTQYLEEADRLADEIVVIDHGRAIARGTADELKDRVGGERIEITVGEGQTAAATAVAAPYAVGELVVDERARHLIVPVTGGAAVLGRVLRGLDEQGVDVRDAMLRRPTLDDVFLTLTGRTAEDVPEDGMVAS